MRTTVSPLRSRVTAALLAALFAAPFAVSSSEPGPPPPPTPRHRLVCGNLLVGRYNPIGVEDRLELEYRYRLFDSASVLWSDAYAGVGLTPTINPSVTRLGATATIRPIAIASLAAAYHFVIWHGAFGHLQSFASPADDTSDSALDRSSGDAAVTTGHELMLRASLAAKAGPIALTSVAELFFARMELDGGDAYYYTPRFDALAKNPGWLVSNDTDLVWISGFGLVLGVRNSLVHAFDAGGGENTPTLRLGPLLAYVFFDRPRAAFNKPALLLVVNWWLRHRFRTGEDVPQGVPYVVLGFRFEGELWAAR